MSTTFNLYKCGKFEVELTESSAKFDLDLYGYLDDKGHDCWGQGSDIPMVAGPQAMTAEETLKMAANIMYAVWCSYPDKADAMAARLANDIPEAACKVGNQ